MSDESTASTRLSNVHMAVAAAVVRACGGTCFGVLGEGNVDFVGELVTLGATYHPARHESGAVAMADGFARGRGDVGLATVSHGPGFTNALTSLIAAVRCRVPLVLVVGSLPGKASRHDQYVDQAAFVGLTGARLVKLGVGRNSSEMVASAVESARIDRMPVVVDIPTSVEASLVSGKSTDVPPFPSPPARPGAREEQASALDAEQLRAAGKILAHARRPVILAGRGAISARSALSTLAEHIGAVLVTTLEAKDLFVDDPWSAGVAGGFSTPAAVRLLHDADVVLAFGASLNALTTRAGTLFPQASLIQCDVDPGVIERRPAADVSLCGDAQEVAQQLARWFAKRHPTLGYRTRQVRELLDRPYRQVDGLRCPEGTVDPLQALVTIDEVLPPERAIVTDGGQGMVYPCTALHVNEPQRFVNAVSFGAIGLGLPTAIGVALADTTRPTVLVAGDGGFLMASNELETVVRTKAPLVIVVLNDRAYGAEVYHLRRHGHPEHPARFDTAVEPAALGRAVGMPAVTVTDSQDLQEAAALACRGGPALIDIRVPQHTPEWFRDLFPEEVDHA